MEVDGDDVQQLVGRVFNCPYYVRKRRNINSTTVVCTIYGVLRIQTLVVILEAKSQIWCLVTSKLCDLITHVDILAAIKTNSSLIRTRRGLGFWKLKSSLLARPDYTEIIGLPRCKTCEVFLCFVTVMFVLSFVLTSLFSLFYVTREVDRFLHREWAEIISNELANWMEDANVLSDD